MTLFEECLQALGPSSKVVDVQKSQEIFRKFEGTFPITKYARVDWSKIEKKVSISSIPEITENVDENLEVMILWDNARLPVVSSTIKEVISVIDDVTAVSFDTWLFSPQEKIVVEFYHEGQVTLGRL